LDLSSNRDFSAGTLDLSGVRLDAETSGSPVIDTTGSRDVTIFRGWIAGQSANTPNVGILQARDDSGASTGDDRFIGTRVAGDYSVASIYNYGVEVCSYIGCRIINEIGHALYVNRANPEGMTSPYATIASGGRSTNDIFVTDGTTVKTAAGDASSAAVYNRGGQLVTVRDSLVLSNAKAGIIHDAADIAISRPTVDNCRFHAAGGTISTHNVLFKDSSGGGGGNINAPTLTNNRWEASGPVVTTDGNPNFQIEFIYHGNRPAGGDAPDLDAADIDSPQINHNNSGYSGDSTFKTRNISDGGIFNGRDFDINFVGDASLILDSNPRIVGDVNIDPSNTFSPSNATTDRTFDADNTTVDELADVVATLIQDIGMND
jgi:hypothetical protein